MAETQNQDLSTNDVKDEENSQEDLTRQNRISQLNDQEPTTPKTPKSEQTLVMESEFNLASQSQLQEEHADVPNEDGTRNVSDKHDTMLQAPGEEKDVCSTQIASNESESQNVPINQHVALSQDSSSDAKRTQDKSSDDDIQSSPKRLKA